MRFLIFGCGYLGKRAAQVWIDGGHTVFAVTRSVTNAELLKAIGIHSIIGDICRPESLAELPDVDVVLHAVGFDPKSQWTREQVTRDGMKNVIQAISGRCSHVIQISSTSVYGQSGGEWVDESSECLPTQISGQLTLAAEQLVLELGATNPSIQTTILRLAGIYGPGRLLTRVESLRTGQPLSGRADSWLNLIHVDDAVAAIGRCLRDTVPSRIYNCVDDTPVERGTYYRELARCVGAPPPRFDETLPALRGSGGLNKRCSNRRLREELNWSPNYSSYLSGLQSALENSNTDLG